MRDYFVLEVVNGLGNLLVKRCHRVYELQSKLPKRVTYTWDSKGTTIGVMKGYTRSLDYRSYTTELRALKAGSLSEVCDEGAEQFSRWDIEVKP